MKRIIALTALIPVLILVTACESLEELAISNESNIQRMDEIQAMPVSDWHRSNWEQINRATNTLTTNISDAVADSKMDELKRITHDHFVNDMKIKKARALAVKKVGRGEARNDIIWQHIDLRLLLAYDTKKEARKLLDNNGYEQFKKELNRFLPKVISRPRFNYYNDSGGGSYGGRDLGKSDSGSYGSVHGQY